MRLYYGIQTQTYLTVLNCHVSGKVQKTGVEIIFMHFSSKIIHLLQQEGQKMTFRMGCD